MKKLISVLLSFIMLLSCSLPVMCLEEETESGEQIYSDWSDPELLQYLQDTVYQELSPDGETGEFEIEDVQAVYVSKEYLRELEYNSLNNIFFGYFLDDVDQEFQGEKYFFTVDENGKTVPKLWTENDESTNQLIEMLQSGDGTLCIIVRILVDGGSTLLEMVCPLPLKPVISFLRSGTVKIILTEILDLMGDFLTTYLAEGMDAALETVERKAPGRIVSFVVREVIYK